MAQATLNHHAKRRIAFGILDFLGGLPLFLTAPLYRHWHMRWGALDDEVRASMAGDELVPEASFNATRAVTIKAPPEHVWPWIVQMGYGRAGFYTYDIADNAGYSSADTLLEEYQHFAVGDWAFNMNSLFGIGNYSGTDLLNGERRAAYAAIRELANGTIELDGDGVGTTPDHRGW